MKILKILVLMSCGLSLFADERTNSELNPKRLAEAKPELERLTAEAIDSYKEGRASKGETAAALIRLASATNLTREVRFLIYSGAFNLYVDANATNEAKALSLKMAFRLGFHRNDVISLWRKKRVKFGEFCPHHDYCPLMLDTLCQRGALDRRFRTAVKADWKDLAMGKATTIAGKRTRGKNLSVEVMSPWKPKARQEIEVSAVDARMKEPSGTCARLYHSKKDGKLFAFDVFFEDQDDARIAAGLERICRGLNEQFSEDLGDVCQKIKDLNRQPSACATPLELHDALNRKVGGVLLGTMDLCVGQRVLRDNGVSSVAIEGIAEEEIHGMRRIRVRVTHLGLLKGAWTAGGGESCPIVADAKDSPMENIPKHTGEESSSGYALAWVARAYEFGLYGVIPDADTAEKMYRKSSIVGNKAAVRWKRGRAEAYAKDDPDGLRLGVSNKAIGGASFSILTLGWDSENGIAPFILGMDGKSLSPMDDVYGLQLALLLNKSVCDGFVAQIAGGATVTRPLTDVSGFQCGCIANLMHGCSSLYGLQVAGLINMIGYGSRIYGGQIGLANAMADATVVQGAQFSLVNAVSEIAGLQCGVGNGAQTVSGVQLGGSANTACQANGVQIAGLANLARKEFEIGSELQGKAVAYALHASGSGDACGLQIAGVCNWTEGRMSGVQIGCINWAESMRGVQIGLINRIGDSKIRYMPLVNWNF